MIKLHFQYFEILGEDYTAIQAFILKGKKVIGHYRNYDPRELKEAPCGNQSETFLVPGIKAARLFLESSGNYICVK